MKVELSQTDVRRISAIALVASKDAQRRVLAGILLDTDGEVVATDSYRLAHAPVEGLGAGTASCEHRDTQYLLPALELAKALAPACKRETPVLLVVEDDDWSVTCGGVTTTGRTIDGQFPEWRMLIPAESPNSVPQDGYIAAFNPQYLATLAKIGATLAGSAKESATATYCARVTAWTREKPVLFKVGTFNFLIMPVRVN